MKDALESLPGIGVVSVTSNGAKDLIDGYTFTVFHGLDTIVPSAKIDFHSVGDWVRLADSQNGPIFNIKAITHDYPYAIMLSRPYDGPNNSTASVFQHGSPSFRLGYQYIVSFNSNLGDIKPLSIDGSTLTGANAYANVISCNENIHQTVTILGGDTLAGYYYLTYAGEKTTRLYPYFNATMIKAALEETSKLHSVTVIENPWSGSFGSKSFLVSLVSLVSWTPPVEDGGEEVVAYLIEYWENDGESFGKTAKQLLRLSKRIFGWDVYTICWNRNLFNVYSFQCHCT